MQNDLLDVMEACLDGELDQVTLEWTDEACVCVVMASGGYPGTYEKGKVIHGISEAEQSFPGKVKVFLAGVKLNESECDWVTNGGRVLGVTALGSDLSQAREIAYKAAELISFEGAMMRSDIANKALV
jgi:phosphoribosylamine--glycine ligase